jgi:hypothetical protein
MLSFWARSLLTATSLAPMLLTYALVYYPVNKGYALGMTLLAAVLVVACKVILSLAKKLIQEQKIRIKSVKIADQAVLTFVLAYLWPLVFARITTVRLGVLIFVFLLLVVVVYHSKAYSFNPLLQLVFGYHFYEVVTMGDFTYVVVSKREMINTRTPIRGLQLSPYMVLDAEEG